MEEVTAGIRVEFYGIPRSRAGVSNTTVACRGDARLRDVLATLAARFPGLAADCLNGSCLRAGYVANLGGERFVTDPSTPLQPGDCLLIMSAEAGG